MTQTQESTALKTGDTVFVTPSNPLARGRGNGTVALVGKTIVTVRFKGKSRAIACLVSDCRKVC